MHPNYASKHESGHAPKLNGGLVIKTNSNQRYATSGVTAFVVRELAKKSGVPMQSFVVRNDCACGSTIGPMYVLYTYSDSSHTIIVLMIIYFAFQHIPQHWN